MSKNVQINNLPSGWKRLKIADLAVIVGGGTPSTRDPENFNGNIPWITPRDLSKHEDRYIAKGDRNLSKAGLSSSSARLVPKDTVLLSSRAPIGYVALAKVPLATNQGFRSLVLQGDNCPEYFYYLLRHNKHLIERMAGGTTFKEISGSTLGAIRLTIPPPDEQAAIAEILGVLDDKIELNRQMNRTLEAIVQSIFKSWFADFDPVVAKANGQRPFGMDDKTAAFFPDRFEDSELGPIPEGWEVAALLDWMEINPRRNLPSNTTAPYLPMADMPTSSAIPENWSDRKVGSGMKFRNGDTLVARITPCLENGKTAYVNFLQPNEVGWGSTEYIVLRPREPYPPEIAYFLARSDELRAFAIANMTGSSGRQRVPASCFNSFKSVVPPADILTTFSRIAKGHLVTMKINLDESRTLGSIRDMLLPKLLSGEIRLGEAEDLVESVSA